LALDRSHYRKPLGGASRSGDPEPPSAFDRKTICFKHIREPCGQAQPTLVARFIRPCGAMERSDMFPLHDDRQHAPELRSAQAFLKRTMGAGSRRSGLGSRRDQKMF